MLWAQATLENTPALAEAAPTTEPLCAPQAIGQRRIPKESILARMASHQGDPYEPNTVERDFNSIWNTGFFQSVWIERTEEPATADTPACIQIGRASCRERV